MRHGAGAKANPDYLSSRLCTGIPEKARSRRPISARSCAVALRPVMCSPSTSSAGVEPDHRAALEASRRGRRSWHPGRSDPRDQPGRLQTRKAARARLRIRCAESCPHRLPSEAWAVTPRRLLRFLSGKGRCPVGPGLSCFAPSPGGAGSRPLYGTLSVKTPPNSWNGCPARGRARAWPRALNPRGAVPQAPVRAASLYSVGRIAAWTMMQ